MGDAVSLGDVGRVGYVYVEYLDAVVKYLDAVGGPSNAATAA
jgi:hypothetical protein